MQRSAILAGTDLSVRGRRLLACQVVGKRHDTVQQVVVPPEPVQIHLGQLGRCDLPCLDEPRQMGDRPEGHILEIRRPGHLGRGTWPERAADAVQLGTGDERAVVHRRRDVIGNLNLPERLVPLETPVEPLDHLVDLLVRELEPGDCEGLCDHGGRDPKFLVALSLVLDRGPEHAGQQRGRETGAREVREKAPPGGGEVGCGHRSSPGRL